MIPKSLRTRRRAHVQNTSRLAHKETEETRSRLKQEILTVLGRTEAMSTRQLAVTLFCWPGDLTYGVR